MPQIKSEKLAQNIGDNACDLDDADLDHDSLLENKEFREDLKRHEDEILDWHNKINSTHTENAFVLYLKDKLSQEIGFKGDGDFFEKLYAMFLNLGANQVKDQLGTLVEAMNDVPPVSPDSPCENIDLNDFNLINEIRPPEPDEHNNGVLERIRGIRGSLLQDKLLLGKLSQAAKKALAELSSEPESMKIWLQHVKSNELPEYKALAKLINSTSTSAKKLESKLQTIYQMLDVYKNMPKAMAKPDVQRMIDRLDKESLSVSARLADTKLYESIKNRVDEMFDARSDGVSLHTKVNAVMQGKNPADKFLSEVMISGKSESSEKTKNKVEALKDAIEYFKDQFTPRLTPRPVNELDLRTYKIASEAINVHIAPSDDFRLIREEGDRKRLFIANFDGSGLDFEAQPMSSNVARIHQAFQALSVDSLHSEYIEGPGTQPGSLDRIGDGITGKSALSRVEAMYDVLCKQTLKWRTDNPECKIAVLAVGFSRGAVEAALLNQLIEDRGIYHPDHTRLIDTETALSRAHRRLYASETPHTRVFYVDKMSRRPFSDRDEKGRQNAAYEKKDLIPAGQISQAYLGFDPVATGLLEKVDRTLPSSVKAALQITAMDESRSLFPVNGIVNNKKPICNIQKNSLNVKVAGAHSDIGGGYSRQRGLEDANFNLAADFIGILTGVRILKKIKVNKDECVVHQSNSRMFKIVSILTGKPPSSSRTSKSGNNYNTTGKLVPTKFQPNINVPPTGISSKFRPPVQVRRSNAARQTPPIDKEKLVLQCLRCIMPIWTADSNNKIQKIGTLANSISEFVMRHGFDRVDDIFLENGELVIIRRANRVGVTVDDEILRMNLQNALRSS